MRPSNSVVLEKAPPARVTGSPRPASVARLVAGFSIEATPKQLESAGAGLRHLPAGTRVHIPFLPRADLAATVVACRRIAAQELHPVPHVAVRAFPSRRALAAHLERLAGHGVESLFLIAGDRKRPAGPFEDTLTAFDSGLLERYGFRNIGVAGHPEGHPVANERALTDALLRKDAYAERTGSAVWIVTQFAFSSDPLIDWVEQLRAAGVRLPVRAGLPGPAKVQTLLRYAAQCGIGASARMLARRPDALTRLLGRWTPDDMLASLARHAAHAPDALAGVHVFPFGGLMQSIEYFNALRDDARS